MLMNNNGTIRVSAVYRSHYEGKADFVHEVDKYLKENVINKNEIVICENLPNTVNINQEFLNNLLEKEY